MPNLVEVTYAQTWSSIKTGNMWMRDMQARAYEYRDAQYLLLKAPPASGKSRALMFIALDKLYNQWIKKVIVAVPERSIGGSFSFTDLVSHWFFANWEPNDKYNLCTPWWDQSKVKLFHEFMNWDEKVLICTHATLRFACEQLDEGIFDNSLIAIDEFHHVSSDKENNKLWEILHGIMNNSQAHIVAMTGSYFRWDSIPVLSPEDESDFVKVTYNYYDQLNGYKYLRTLWIWYAFYVWRYCEPQPLKDDDGNFIKDDKWKIQFGKSGIMEALDLDKKTIIHIPNVNWNESTKDKYREVDIILDQIWEVLSQDQDTWIIEIKRHDNWEILKIANLVDDTETIRIKVQEYLRNIKKVDDIDIIIALWMAKEWFDWPYCEHALTVWYRGSLTEVIQIIGRCTRDSSNKTHAQFTNLIAQPDANDEQVNWAVNNMLKAITCSLLMEQVLAPNFKFKAKYPEWDDPQPWEIHIHGFKEPSSKKIEDIIETDLNDLKAQILQDDTIVKSLPWEVDPEVINKVLIPKIIKEKYPDLTEEEVEEIRQYVVVDSAIKNSNIKEVWDKKFITMACKFVNIDDLHIDLIDSINPFQQAFSILSKSVNAPTLKLIQDVIESNRVEMTEDEALILWPKIKEFVKNHEGKQPDRSSLDPLEKRMAEAILYLRKKRQEQGL